MTKRVKPAVDTTLIKKLVIIGMFSDDILMDELVVKGGNAIDIILKVGSRASVDVDFSMDGDLPGGLEAAKARIEKALADTFLGEGLSIFDFNLEAKPSNLSLDVADFWGGYAIDFKLIETVNFHLHGSIDALRRNALRLGQSTKFSIDISRFEYTIGKQAVEVDGFRIYAYSPLMIASEKLRAICQQMPKYGPIIHRERQGTARARDFLDIHTMVKHFKIDIAEADSVALLRGMFAAKRVPLSFLQDIKDFREFHRQDWPSVLDTVRSGTKVEDFDFYFDFVLEITNSLESLRDE